MPDMPRQLTLDLPLDPRYGAEDFLVSPSNEHAYGFMESWPDWPDTILTLSGPRGSGKSHLLAIWATSARARTIKASEIAGSHIPELLLTGALAVEDVDQGELDEAALFHLLNLARERKAYIVLTSEKPPNQWGLRTADLLSRLRLAPAIALHPPDDALLKAVLVKLFVDRQIVVDTTVVDYIALRIERSLARAAEIVAMLDQEALSRSKRVSRAIAAEILGGQEMEDSE
jgi:chromosomal replication initiation ATPase DnaA